MVRRSAARSIKSHGPPRRNTPSLIELIRRATHNTPSTSHKKTASPRNAEPGDAMPFWPPKASGGLTSSLNWLARTKRASSVPSSALFRLRHCRSRKKTLFRLFRGSTAHGHTRWLAHLGTLPSSVSAYSGHVRAEEVVLGLNYKFVWHHARFPSLVQELSAQS